MQYNRYFPFNINIYPFQSIYFKVSSISTIFEECTCKGTLEYDLRGISQLIKHQIKQNDGEQKIAKWSSCAMLHGDLTSMN